MSFQPTSTNWLLSINCCSVVVVLLSAEVSDSLLYFKWHFLFQGTLIQALLSSYLKGYFDHHCLHGSHNAKEMLHRLGLVLLLSSPKPCSNIPIWQISWKFRASKCLSVPCSFWKKSYLILYVEMERGSQQLLTSAFRMGWRPLSGNIKCSVWAVGDNEPAGGEMTLLWWKVGTGQADNRQWKR